MIVTIDLDTPTPAKGEPEAEPPRIMASEGIASRYRMTTVSAALPKACSPPNGMNSAVTTRLTRPT